MRRIFYCIVTVILLAVTCYVGYLQYLNSRIDRCVDEANKVFVRYRDSLDNQPSIDILIDEEMAARDFLQRLKQSSRVSLTARSVRREILVYAYKDKECIANFRLQSGFEKFAEEIMELKELEEHKSEPNWLRTLGGDITSSAIILVEKQRGRSQ